MKLPRPSRWLIVLAIFYGIGLVASVLFAWTFVLIAPNTGPERFFVRVDARNQHYMASRQRCTGRESWTVSHVPPDRYHMPDPPPWLPMPGDHEQYSLTEAYGWPRPCLMQHGYLFQTGWEPDRGQSFTWHRGLKTYYFPTRVIPANLFLNAAVIAPAACIPWLALKAGTHVLRLWLRRRRRACPKCGYDTSTLAPGTPCPECGRKTEPVREPVSPPLKPPSTTPAARPAPDTPRSSQPPAHP